MRIISKKIALLGDWATGKTSLIRRFVMNTFDDKYIQTIGTKVSKKIVKFQIGDDQVTVNLIIWDLLGQREFHRVHKEAYRGVDGAMLVCDVTREETLKSIQEYWYPSLTEVAENVPVVLIGNKCDLKNEAVFWLDDIKHVGRALGMSDGMCHLTSAKTGEQVEHVFHLLAECTAVLDETISIENMLEKIVLKEDIPEPANYKDYLDYLIVDFVHTIGNTERAMDMVRMSLRECEMDINNIERQKLRKLIDVLQRKEIEFGINADDANKTREKRIAVLQKIS
jgi:small GTP-binding protein